MASKRNVTSLPVTFTRKVSVVYRPHAFVLGLSLTIVAIVSGGGAQQPGVVETSAIGPQVGATVPAFSGVDQFGRAQSLESSRGPKGTMLVFFRSADW
jgi:hypothetical protein